MWVGERVDGAGMLVAGGCGGGMGDFAWVPGALGRCEGWDGWLVGWGVPENAAACRRVGRRWGAIGAGGWWEGGLVRWRSKLVRVGWRVCGLGKGVVGMRELVCGLWRNVVGWISGWLVDWDGWLVGGLNRDVVSGLFGGNHPT